MILKNIKIDGKNPNEFADDVLNILNKRKVKYLGCKPSYVELKIDGSVKCVFQGYRGFKPYQGSVEFSCPFALDKLMLADPAVVADVCEQSIQAMKLDYNGDY